MNALESQLDYCLGTATPEPGRVIEVAPGVLWARMTLPFQLNHINVWLLRDATSAGPGAPAREGWSIVDCGIDNVATRAAWEEIFANALGGLPVLRVIVTHMHPDHIGCAHWLCERWGVRLWISATDYGIARMATRASAGFGGPLSAAFMAQHGMAADREKVGGVAARSNYYKSLVPDVPASYRRLLGGNRVAIGSGASRADWTCHAGYGHAPEHIALHCERVRVLISGDMVLPRISTNVSVIDVEPEADPLTLYLDSIERMRAIEPGVLVLPSHGLPFKGLHARIGQLQAHHDERFVETLEACAVAPQSAFELVPVLFKRPLDLHQMTFAIGESIAHLHALWYRGKLERLIGADEVIRFRTI
ncbi:MAG TPA: MBL fold metallo-hydrolase [Caldimonas sp.]|jgi:glyoxylase-like metal-dependent hydrolase (beta-lactamase superfamily II)|nr:MBL fold metallo-hydrolase [Caldimonas sp.]HEX4233721.1 MBL fold metallo-hydrolase [Caldimonas sp.]